jgi:hypothetical protein
MSAASEAPTVLYVAGMARSGTTLLALLLGAQERVFGAGELRRYWWGRDTPGWLCGCGRTVDECPFWSAVQPKVSTGGEQERRRIRELHRERLRLRPRQLIALRRDCLRRAEWCVKYAAAVDELYRAVAEVSGSRVVVDSSKELPDGYLVSRLSSLPVHVVHMVRDPRAVAHSFARRVPTRQPYREFMPRGGSISTAAKWDVRTLCAERMFAPLGERYSRIAYEDLVKDPVAALTPLAHSLRLADPPRGDGAHAVNHTFDGNPRRLAPDQPLEIDDEWRREMPRGASALVTAATWPMARRYGYTSSGHA